MLEDVGKSLFIGVIIFETTRRPFTSRFALFCFVDVAEELVNPIAESPLPCQRRGKENETCPAIRVEQKPECLMLIIQDDGQDFDMRHMKRLGLLGIQERVARLGNKSSIHQTGRRDHPFGGIAVHEGTQTHRNL